VESDYQLSENPLVEGLERLPVRSTVLVIFGAMGDLASRKLLPAIYNLAHEGALPERIELIGISRGESTDEKFREHVRESVDRFSRRRPNADVLNGILETVHYIRGAFDDADLYARLRAAVEGLDEKFGTPLNRVFYLSTAPEFFPVIVENLGEASLNTAEDADVRVVIEKPIGYDLASARLQNEAVRNHFDESQVFRIDHYLGKETVQNLIALRFGNTLFEPLWRRGRIRHVQITIAEQLGVEGRGQFYEHTGALRDMVQNHLLQLVCILAMEPPTSSDPDAVRDEKLKVLRALRPIVGSAVQNKTVRGQYRAGAVNGQPVPGYLDETGVAADSTTETFVALKAEIDTWRWAGVPFYLRTGKRLQERVTEIVVTFEDVPHSIFESAGTHGRAPNRLVIRLQPQESITLTILAKMPGETMRLKPVDLALDLAGTFKEQRLDAYERLLTDVVKGNLTLFMRRDELDAAWRWIDPIREGWAQHDERIKSYVAGSWGPAASSALISRDGFAWQDET
jgi:glucose-6-phosphate 1-dehydrogenase